jgi:hypothetical protein
MVKTGPEEVKRIVWKRRVVGSPAKRLLVDQDAKKAFR